jgi:hypothetical protein
MLLIGMQVVELLAKIQRFDAWHPAVYAKLPGLVIGRLHYTPEFFVYWSRAYDKGLALQFGVPYLFACGKEIIHINIKYENHLKHDKVSNSISLCIAIAGFAILNLFFAMQLK